MIREVVTIILYRWNWFNLLYSQPLSLWSMGSRRRRRSGQWCIKFLIAPVRGGGLSSLLGKNIKLWRGYDRGKEYNLEKGESESNIIFSIILSLWRRILRGEEVGNFGEDNQDSKNWGWRRISSCWVLYTPLDQAPGEDAAPGRRREIWKG